MWFTWDSAGNVFFEEEGPKRDAARAKCGPARWPNGSVKKTCSGKGVKSSYVECRGLEREFTQEKHEDGKDDRPTEFREARVVTDAFGGETPKTLAKKIAGILEKDKHLSVAYQERYGQLCDSHDHVEWRGHGYVWVETTRRL